MPNSHSKPQLRSTQKKDDVCPLEVHVATKELKEQISTAEEKLSKNSVSADHKMRDCVKKFEELFSNGEVNKVTDENEVEEVEPTNNTVDTVAMVTF